jgi:hypothetical protein
MARRGLSPHLSSILISVLFASSALAFHDSRIDPRAKRTLEWVVSYFEDACESGDRRGCASASKTMRFADQLALSDEQCRQGATQACEALHYGYGVLNTLALQVARHRATALPAVRAAPGSSPTRETPGGFGRDSETDGPEIGYRASPAPRDDPSLRWYDQTMAPAMRNAQRSYDRAMATIEKNRSSEATETYRRCRADGIAETHCQMIAGQQDLRVKSEREQAEIRRMSEQCGKGDAAACDWMRKKKAEMVARSRRLELMGKAQDFRERTASNVRQSERAVEERNQRADDREMARGYHGWAGQERQEGDTAAAETYQERGDYYHERAISP